MSKTRSLTHHLKRLPNSWVFGAGWVAALLAMAAGAARSDQRIGRLLDTLAHLAASAP
jgi:hypothetical protein